MKIVSLLGVEIVIRLDASEFITPYWEDVIAQYPAWRATVNWGEDEPWTLAEYMRGYAVELERLGVRCRAADDWMRRYFEHFGSAHLMDAIRRYRWV